MKVGVAGVERERGCELCVGMHSWSAGILGMSGGHGAVKLLDRVGSKCSTLCVSIGGHRGYCSCIIRLPVTDRPTCRDGSITFTPTHVVVEASSCSREYCRSSCILVSANTPNSYSNLLVTKWTPQSAFRRRSSAAGIGYEIQAIVSSKEGARRNQARGSILLKPFHVGLCKIMKWSTQDVWDGAFLGTKLVQLSECRARDLHMMSGQGLLLFD